MTIANPIYLTEEERNELKQLWKDHYANNTNICYNNYYGDDDDWYDYNAPKPSNRRTKHDYEALLLINSTVYTCKLCGAKKEKETDEYCPDKEEF
jgi:hypothetical protein